MSVSEVNEQVVEQVIKILQFCKSYKAKKYTQTFWLKAYTFSFR